MPVYSLEVRADRCTNMFNVECTETGDALADFLMAQAREALWERAMKNPPAALDYLPDDAEYFRLFHAVINAVRTELDVVVPTYRQPVSAYFGGEVHGFFISIKQEAPRV